MLELPPSPLLYLSWEEEARARLSDLGAANRLPQEIREVIEKTGFGCLAAQTDIGIVHVCHAIDSDIEGFSDRPVSSQWQIMKMPTAPLTCLQLDVIDQLFNP